jgi:hypothetical protein
VAVYAVCAVGFHWVVEPAVKSQPVAPYEPSVATIVQPATSYVTPAGSNVPSRVTSRPPASATMTAAAPRAEPPRVAPPMSATAAPQPADGARSEPSPRVPPPMTIVAPKSAETARAEATPQVAAEAQGSAVAAAAPETTENAAPAPKKPKKTARKAPRHERQRDFYNPLNFFAWGGNNGGWRRSF